MMICLGAAAGASSAVNWAFDKYENNLPKTDDSNINTLDRC